MDVLLFSGILATECVLCWVALTVDRGTPSLRVYKQFVWWDGIPQHFQIKILKPKKEKTRELIVVSGVCVRVAYAFTGMV